MTQQTPYINQIMHRLSDSIEVPHIELLYQNNPYVLIVAVVLSAQATDISVNKALPKLFQCDTNILNKNTTPLSVINNTMCDWVSPHVNCEYNLSPLHLVNLGIEEIEKRIQTIGLYRNKAKFLYHLSQDIIEKHNGCVPRTREELEALPGVGRKSANIILSAIWGEKTIAVDTHVFRVANRMGIAEGKTPRAVEDQLMKIVPDEYLYEAHFLLVLHGRYVCKARKPLCEQCCLNNICKKVGINNN
jgi:endonuclease-3